MKPGVRILLGIGAGLIWLVLVLGGMATAMMEAGEPAALLLSPTPTWTPVPTQLPGQPTFTPSPTALPTETATFQPPTSCPPPEGWIAVAVLSGDSLEGLAARYGTSVEAIQVGNCLVVSSVSPGSLVYLPPLPPTATATATVTHTPTPPPATAAPTSRPCGAPRGWVQYRVRAGDTLYGLSRLLGVSVPQLQEANCLGNSTTIRAGTFLWVPFIPPTRTPSATPVPPTAPPPTWTSPPPATDTEVPPTRTTIPSPTNTDVPPSLTPEPRPSDTAVPPSLTPEPQPSDTAVPPSLTPETQPVASETPGPVATEPQTFEQLDPDQPDRLT